jgi:hypothetical protein
MGVVRESESGRKARDEVELKEYKEIFLKNIFQLDSDFSLKYIFLHQFPPVSTLLHPYLSLFPIIF